MVTEIFLFKNLVNKLIKSIKLIYAINFNFLIIILLIIYLFVLLIYLLSF